MAGYASPVPFTSGDPIADRRLRYGADLLGRGDVGGAVDLFAQVIEIAPQFTAAWFMLGEARDKLGDRAGAVEAYRRAQALDRTDEFGAGLQLVRLGAKPICDMPQAYVRTLFDQYAPTFDTALAALNYRAPELLFDAAMAACETTGREPYFDRALDLGCGTGLAARTFARRVDAMHGVDLSPVMIDCAERTGLYSSLKVADMLPWLCLEGTDCADLIIAADALVYIRELMPLFREACRVLEQGGLLAFTVETHAGSGVVLGEKLRFAHGVDYVRDAVSGAGLAEVAFAEVSTRTENNAPVPGLLVVAQQRARPLPPANG